MAHNQTIPVRRAVLQSDLNAHLTIQALADYQPANPAYSKEALQARHDALQAASEAELQAQNALAAARDASVAAEWEFHNLMLGIKDQVIAQYGADSDQVQSLGLKKKSEHKRPARRPAA